MGKRYVSTRTCVLGVGLRFRPLQDVLDWTISGQGPTANATPICLADAVDREAERLSKHRHTWSSRVEFLFFMLGFVVGVGNLWRFLPVRAVRRGAFVLVYLCCLAMVAAPLFFYEMVLGQATQRGPSGALKIVHPWTQISAFTLCAWWW